MRVNRRGRLRGKSNAGARVSTRLPPALRASRHSVIHWVILFFFAPVFSSSCSWRGGRGGVVVDFVVLSYWFVFLRFFSVMVDFRLSQSSFFAFVCTYSMLYCNCAMCITCIIYQYFLFACFIPFIISLFPLCSLSFNISSQPHF